MSNRKWGNANEENKSQDQHQRVGDGEDEEEFGEFEGFEGNGHLEPNVAQPLQPALQPGMSPWSHAFPDYVPSQHTASSALQPDLLPMQATSNMHASQMTDSNSSLGEASSFDLPDVNPHDPGAGGGGHHGEVRAASTLPLEATNHHPKGGGASGQLPLALPDVSSGNDQARANLPDVRANLNSASGQHLQGAIPRNRVGGGNGAAAEALDPAQLGCTNGTSQAATQKAYLEEQLSNSRLLSQRLTTETQDLQQRVNDLESQLSRCRSHLNNQNHVETNIESVIQGALQRQRTEIVAEMQGQMSRLERTLGSSANAAMVEDRLQSLLTENNNRQLAAIENRLTAFAENLSDIVRTTVQTAMSSSPADAATASDLEKVLKRFTDEQRKRDADDRSRILSCLESVFANGRQQLQVLLRPNGDPGDDT